MSYLSLLKMRCNVLALHDGNQDGMIYQSWSTVYENIRCFLDLGFIRAGKDPVWTPDSGTAQNRSGVLFLPPHTDAVPGNRVQVTSGPPGTFEIASSLDEAWTPRKLHHLECFVIEVNRVLVSDDDE